MSIIFDIPSIQTLHEVMTSSYSIIIIDIYADWCQPCKILAPKLEELAQLYSSADVLFCKLNNETGIRQNIQGLPTIEFWVTKDDGKKYLFHTVTGANLTEIKDTLSKLTSTNPTSTSQSTQKASTKSALPPSPYRKYSSL